MDPRKWRGENPSERSAAPGTRGGSPARYPTDSARGGSHKVAIITHRWEVSCPVYGGIPPAHHVKGAHNKTGERRAPMAMTRTTVVKTLGGAAGMLVAVGAFAGVE